MVHGTVGLFVQDPLSCLLRVRLKATVLFVNPRKQDKGYHMLQNAPMVGMANSSGVSRIEVIFTYQWKESQDKQTRFLLGVSSGKLYII